MKQKHFLRRISALLLVLCFLMQCSPLPVHAEETVIHIRNLDEWNQFAENCTLDTWSQDKQVILETDLHLTDTTIIPTFGGTFDGNGFTISGVKITREGSHIGLFRYVQSGAVIQNLTVSGTVSPDGASDTLGGIVGTNAGTITHCTFRGTVDGTNRVGGIAGVNEGDGEILNCTVSGNISGDHFTGGIAGENYGSVILCINRADVNTHMSTVSTDLDNLDWSNLNDTQNVPACTDSGGIVGFSKGILQNCTNYANVGYPHTGYNVGGIAGRQAGYMDGCVNAGHIQGRKDVGGIVGQMEPYTQLQFKEDTLMQLFDALDGLSTLMDQTLTHAQSSSQSISSELTGLNTLTNDARVDLDSLLTDIEEWGSGSIDTVNDLSARISRVLNQMSPALNDLQSFSANLSNACTMLENALDTMDTINDPNSKVYREIHAALDSMETGLTQVGQALDSIHNAIIKIIDSLGDPGGVQSGTQDLTDALGDLSEGLGNLSGSTGDLTDSMGELVVPEEEQGSLDDTVSDLEDTQAALESMAEAAQLCSAAVMPLPSALNDSSSFGDVLSDLADALHAFADAAQSFRTSSDHAQSAFREVQSLAAVASESMKTALSLFSDSTWNLSTAMDKLEDIVRQEADADPLQLPKLDSSFHQTQDHLNSTLGSLSEQLESLNQTAVQTTDQLTSDLKQINQQFSKIVGLLRKQLTEDETGEHELIVDISDTVPLETTNSPTTGTVSACMNRGTIEGDLNIGGLVGAMAIEFDFDPEDDVDRNGSNTPRFQYFTRAILRDSVNHGEVTGRKDSIGGAVGLMDLGLVDGCESYGDLESTSGAYVGGIAGTSESTIQNCWVKCHIKGLRYLGGIAGQGENILNCRVFARVDESCPYTGAIAGIADGTLSENYFVDDRLGAIDGISYDGKAQNISYETLMEEPNVPDELKAFTLTFTADGHIVTSRVFRYGDALSDDRMPSVPKKEGFYGEWEPFDTEHLVFDMTVDAEYTPWETTLFNESGDALVEGTFKPQTSIQTVEGTLDRSAEVPDPVLQILVTLSDPEQTFQAVRIKTPADLKHPEVWLSIDGETWEKSSFTEEGSFLRIPCTASEVEICIAQSTGYTLMWIGLILIFVLLAAVAVVIRRKRRNSPVKKTDA